MERLLAVKELAELIGLSPATIYSLVECRQIPVQRVRRRVMFAPCPDQSERANPAPKRLNSQNEH